MGLIDLHCDTLSRLVNSDQTIKENDLCVNYERLRAAESMVQFFACFVKATNYEKSPLGKWDGAYEDVLRMIRRMKDESYETPEIQIAHHAEEIAEFSAQRKLSAMLTVEEGGVLNGDMSRLKELYDEGIRLMTLTWNFENCIGFPNSDDEEAMKMGLKHFGIEVVEYMNELGMIVDVSHLSDGGFWDCIRHSKRPIMASHSNARAICDHRRNLSDEMLRALGETGGVAGLNFYPAFLHKNSEDVTLQNLADHAVHMINVGGEDVLAIGTDFDGFTYGDQKNYIYHIGEMERVWYIFKKNGIKERQLDKVWSENALRVIKNSV